MGSIEFIYQRYKKGKALKNQRLAGKIKIPIFLNALVS